MVVGLEILIQFLINLKGAPSACVGCYWFRDFLFSNGLEDLGACGAQFTWCHGSLSQRLDRALGNSEWDSFAPECSVRNLHRLKSNHRSILVSLKPIRCNGARLFRCIAGWLLHDGFQDVLTGNWSNSLDIEENLVRV